MTLFPLSMRPIPAARFFVVGALVLVLFPPPCPAFGTPRLEAVGADRTGAAHSRTESGAQATLAIGPLVSKSSRSARGLHVVVGPAMLGIVAEWPTPPPEPTVPPGSILAALLGKARPTLDMDRNLDGTVDIADVLRDLYAFGSAIIDVLLNRLVLDPAMDRNRDGLIDVGDLLHQGP